MAVAGLKEGEKQAESERHTLMSQSARDLLVDNFEGNGTDFTL